MSLPIHRPIVLERSRPEDADRHGLVWMVLPADFLTPVTAFLRLRAGGREPGLLESAEGPERLARHSFLPCDPDAHLFADEDGRVRIEGVPGADGATEGPLLARLTAVAEPRAVAPPPGLPPFLGGWVGALSYAWAGELEPRVAAAARRAGQRPSGEPMADFRRYPTVVAFDHAAQRLYLVRRCRQGGAGFEDAFARLEGVADDLVRPVPPSGAFELGAREPRSSLDRAGYVAGVEALAAAIRQGEVFQAVLARRLEWDFVGDPFTLYRMLRLTNPAPHMFYFSSGGRTLVGSSPERLVSVTGRRVQNRPIAGTRPRHAVEAEDRRLGAELLADAKERAEHDMLVDLARNDLGRIARTGTVEVMERAVLERFARVQHLVSRVECDLASSFGPLDALAAAFPAGTVSGAPKVRAMELLAGLEPVARGAYAGAFGYLDDYGNLDTAIVLRTFVANHDAAAPVGGGQQVRGTVSIGAGAGIVHDSRPEAEFLETEHKARAVAEALELAAREGGLR